MSKKSPFVYQPSDKLELGKCKDTGRDVFISTETRREHMHVVGSTGEGKSKFLEHMLREDILNERGLCLLDPHGSLYDDIVRWCTSKEMFKRKKIILINPLEEDWTFGFNPLNIESKEISFHVDSMVEAVARVWGGEDLNTTPRLKRCLRMIFHALAAKKFSLYEARYLVSFQQEVVRKYITHDIQDPVIAQLWEDINHLKERQFFEEFGSSLNRLTEFLASPIIRNIIGQTENILDLRKIMDEGYILLVNLSARNRVSKSNARLLGTLIINELFMTALGRKSGARSFYLYIDECYDFIGEDIGYILDQCRKFGLHAILSHQHLEQLKRAGDIVYKSVMTNAKTKVIFGGLEFEDAETFVKNVFIGDIDLEEWKSSSRRPMVVGYDRIWFQNYNSSENWNKTKSNMIMRGDSDTDTDMESDMSGFTSGSTTGYVTDGSFMSPVERETRSTTSGYMTGENRGTARSYGSFRSEAKGVAEARGGTKGEGRNEGIMPILGDFATQAYSLEEQIWRAVALMVNQRQQHAIIKMPKKKAVFIKTPSIKPASVLEGEIEQFEKKCYQSLDFVKDRLEIEQQLQERQKNIEKMAKEFEDSLKQRLTDECELDNFLAK